MQFVSPKSFFVSSLLKSITFGALVSGALITCLQSQAVTMNFSIDEGYSSSESVLNGQPSASPQWLAHDSWLVNGSEGILDTNRGYSSGSLTAVYQPAGSIAQGESIRVSVDFQFAGLGGNSSASRYVFSTAIGTDSNPSTAFGHNFGKVILARLENASNYVIYFSTDTAGYSGAKTIAPSAIGDSGTLDDMTDNLRMTLTMTKGSSASDWTVELSLTNLDTSIVVATATLTGVSTSEAFYASHELYALFATLTSAQNGGPSSLTVDQFSTSISEPKSSAMIFGGALLVLAWLARHRMKHCFFLESESSKGTPREHSGSVSPIANLVE